MGRPITPRSSWQPIPRIKRRNDTGATALEFALIAPVFIALVMGMLMWGGWFWLAHSVQQLANDAARASVAGLDATERRELATAAVAQGAAGLGELKVDRLRTVVTESGGDLSVRVTYDATDLLPDLTSLAAAPDPHITRTARVRTAGS